MKKQDIMHFFDEHKTEIICLGVGIGIGAYAMYRHHFGPICQDVSHAVLKVSGKKKLSRDCLMKLEMTNISCGGLRNCKSI